MEIDGTAGAFTLIWSWRVADWLAESVTRAVKSNVPAAVGEPEMLPFAFSVKPCGNVPADAVHAYGGVPPVAVIVPVYAWPTVPAGSAVVEIVGAAAALIVIWSWRVAD